MCSVVCAAVCRHIKARRADTMHVLDTQRPLRQTIRQGSQSPRGATHRARRTSCPLFRAQKNGPQPEQRCRVQAVRAVLGPLCSGAVRQRSSLPLRQPRGRPEGAYDAVVDGSAIATRGCAVGCRRRVGRATPLHGAPLDAPAGLFGRRPHAGAAGLMRSRSVREALCRRWHAASCRWSSDGGHGRLSEAMDLQCKSRAFCSLVCNAARHERTRQHNRSYHKH